MGKVEKDYEELLRLFNKHKVKYVIVGAYAVAFHALPRYTKDMDILIKDAPDNARKMVRALNEFGFSTLKLAESDFIGPGKIVQLGYEPVRVDIVTSIDGCRFDDVWTNRKKGVYGRERVFFIGLNDLMRNKKAANRKQDQADLEILKAPLRKQKGRRV